MHKVTLRSLAVIIAVAAAAGPSWALGPRVPQIVFNGASLQNYFNSVGQTINVNTDQMDVQAWATTVSNNATFTIQLELAGNAAGNSVGVYNTTGGPNPTLFEIFPGSAGVGWFAVASFNVGGPGNLKVNLFDNNANFVSQTSYSGINSNSFGFYLMDPSPTVFYGEDSRNGGAAQALVYSGTGTSAGQWWLAFEDTPFGVGDDDFDDFVVFMESVNAPVPTIQTTWGYLKLTGSR
jgi:hypothetical protein